MNNFYSISKREIEMSVNIVLTALSVGMKDAVISRWLKKEGEMVNKGEPLVDVETDKATLEIEAPDDGRLARIYVADGTKAKVGDTLAVFLLEDENEDSLLKTESSGPKIDSPGAATELNGGKEGQQIGQKTMPVAASIVEENKTPHISASPLARRLARSYNIDLSQLKGTGPKGRIVKIDVEKTRDNLSKSQNFTTDKMTDNIIVAGLVNYTRIPHSTMRKVIAARLTEAKTTIPHFYLSRKCEMDNLLKLRQEINDRAKGAYRISVNDFVIKAAAAALKTVKDANVIWTDDALLKLHDIDVSVAVAVDGGLITPVIRKADKLTLTTISDEMKTLSAKAKEGRLTPAQYQGGSFSISNLGMYGVDSFSAIINPPQSSILAVGKIRKIPVEKDDTVVLRQIMTCNLSLDHRAIDGALGSKLLAAIVEGLENPMSLII